MACKQDSTRQKTHQTTPAKRKAKRVSSNNKWMISVNTGPSKCLVCGKKLKPVGDDSFCQPWGGGEVSVRFDFGSRFDQMTEFGGWKTSGHTPAEKLCRCEKIVGIICDDCFEKLAKNPNRLQGFRVKKQTTHIREV